MALATLVAGWSLLAAPGGAAPPALSNDQQAQIQAIVRQYIAAHPEVIEQALVAHPEMVEKATQTLEARRAWARYQKIAADPRQFSIGPKDAKIGIVEFFDYRCPHCKDALAWTMDKVRTRRDVRVIFVEYPILSPQSLEASQAALASMKQGRYLAFHQALMASRSTLESKDIDALARQSGIDVLRMRRDMKDRSLMALLQDNQDTAAASKVEGTPAYIINGKFFYGYQPAELDQGLRQATANARGKV